MADAPNLSTNNVDETRSHQGVHAGLHNDANREINRLHTHVKGLLDRHLGTFAAGTLASGGTATGVVVLAPGYRIYQLSVNVTARLRLYTSVAKRDADLNREIGTDPAPNSGLILDYVTTGAGTVDLSPLVDGFTADGTANVPIILTNRSASSLVVDATFLYKKTE